MSADLPNSGFSDDVLRQAWRDLRAAEAASTSRNDGTPPSPPAPEDIANALSGQLSDEEMVHTLDDALRHGAADDVALLYALRSAARDAVPEQPVQDAVIGPVVPISGARRRVPAWTWALAASLVLALGIPLWLRTRDVTPVDDMRGRVSASTPVLMTPAPAAGVQDSMRFTWTRVTGARSYVVEWLDTTGQPVQTLSTVDTSVVLTLSDAEAGARVTAWWVTARFDNAPDARSALRPLTPAVR